MIATRNIQLLVAVLLLLVAGVFPSPRCKAQPYREYYELISHAFDQIANADYPSALQTYKKAFAKFPKHPVGVEQAIDCALYLGDTAFAMQCLREQIGMGRTVERIKREHNHRYFTDPVLKQLEKEYPTLRATYSSLVDSSCYRLLNEMQKKDQLYAKRRILNGDVATYINLQYQFDSIILENSKKLHHLFSSHTLPEVPMFGNFIFPFILMAHHVQALSRFDRRDGAHPDYFNDTRAQQLYGELKNYDMRPMMVQLVHSGDIPANAVYNMFELASGMTLGSNFITQIQLDLQNRNITYVQRATTLAMIQDSLSCLLMLDSWQKTFDQQMALHSYLSQELYPFDEAIALCIQYDIYAGEVTREKEKKWDEFKQQIAQRFLDNDPRVTVFKIKAPFYQVKFPMRKQ